MNAETGIGSTGEKNPTGIGMYSDVNHLRDDIKAEAMMVGPDWS